MAYGQVRVALVDRVVHAAARAARAGRLAVRLLSRTRLGPSDLYAALATARFMAAHELVERAGAQAAATGDPEVEITQIRQPLWFGGTEIWEDRT
ncbi:hypothetical protein RM574_25595 [Streptomyces sp. DSM 41982]|uniref:Uncharacterized protein n=1 Tax=Streptomyces evansiae TaxID=3075535 RepID=A0ABD5EBS6_9ACTN|nr:MULTISPECIES: hypothetical protein [unclassified Streptomyces]MDT0418859.1 hypothetical protein [Streptomyces sp. DSM 41982]SCD62361.1 hypothetical protein GA0115246_103899 [Streptomyces sp. SolWspMP-sol7th]